MDVPAGAPPGNYRLTTGIHELRSGRRLALAGGSTEVELGTVQIVAAGDR